jgi:hypothetical protein
MLRIVALLRDEVSEELSASIIRMKRIGELTMLSVTSNRRDLRRYINRLTLFLVQHSCHPDDGGAKFLRNVSSYKSHTA